MSLQSNDFIKLAISPTPEHHDGCFTVAVDNPVLS